jgi:hypothetical protein
MRTVCGVSRGTPTTWLEGRQAYFKTRFESAHDQIWMLQHRQSNSGIALPGSHVELLYTICSDYAERQGHGPISSFHCLNRRFRLDLLAYLSIEVGRPLCADMAASQSRLSLKSSRPSAAPSALSPGN